MPLRSGFTLAAPGRSVCLLMMGHYMPMFEESYIFSGSKKSFITGVANQLQATATQVTKTWPVRFEASAVPMYPHPSV
jgi:hypothetical protein